MEKSAELELKIFAAKMYGYYIAIYAISSLIGILISKLLKRKK